MVRGMSCAACGIHGWSVNAHVVKGDKGMGYKAGCECIAPLCHSRLGVTGCHFLYDEYRADFDKLYPDFDPIAAAAATEEAWQRLSNREIL
jgi:hypothetical protein